MQKKIEIIANTTLMIRDEDMKFLILVLRVYKPENAEQEQKQEYLLNLLETILMPN